MNRRRILISTSIALLAVALGFGLYYGVGSGQSSYALSVNGKHFSQGQIATRVAFARLAATASAGSGATVNGNLTTPGGAVRSLIQQEVQVQEAERRGLTCTSAEASAQEATQVAQGVAAGATNEILAAAIGLGIVPPDYLLTPVAQRTPSITDAIATYTSPAFAQDAVRDCEIGKLYGQVRQQNAGSPAPTAEAAIRALRDQLINSASVDGPALSQTPVPAATPTP